MTPPNRRGFPAGKVKAVRDLEVEPTLRVLEDTARYTGVDFFDALCAELSQFRDFKFVRVAEIVFDEGKARIVTASRCRCSSTISTEHHAAPHWG